MTKNEFEHIGDMWSQGKISEAAYLQIARIAAKTPKEKVKVIRIEDYNMAVDALYHDCDEMTKSVLNELTGILQDYIFEVEGETDETIL